VVFTSTTILTLAWCGLVFSNFLRCVCEVSDGCDRFSSPFAIAKWMLCIFVFTQRKRGPPQFRRWNLNDKMRQPSEIPERRILLARLTSHCFDR